MEASSTLAQTRRWLLISTLLNAVLAVLKLGWGLFSGSTVVLADAIHSFSDVLGALLVYGAVRFSSHHSSRFPLGMYKLEDIAALLGGLGVLFAGYEILRSVFFGDGVADASVPFATLGFMTLILLVQMVFYRSEKRAAAHLNSPGLNSDVINWLGDMGAGLVVMVGIGGHMLGVPYAQELAVIIIAVMIFYGAYEVIRDSLYSLLDASAASSEREEIQHYLASLPALVEIRDLYIHSAGSVLFVRATLVLDVQNFSKAHQLVDDVAEQLKQKIPRIEEVTLHYEPVSQQHERIATLFDADRKTIASHFGKAHYIRLEEMDGDRQTQSWFSNPFSGDERGKSMKLIVWLLRNRVTKVHLLPENISNTLIEMLDTVGIDYQPVADSTTMPETDRTLEGGLSK